MKTRKLTLASLLVAVGAASGSVIFIPVGVSKCFPVQHTINVMAAVLLGPYYGTAIAFCISLIRNFTGTGSLLAFPGSMAGALLSGFIFYKTRNVTAAALGEVFGTGILGGLLAFPIAKFIMGKQIAAFFFIPPFLISTIGGSIIAWFLIKFLDTAKVLKRIQD